MNIGIVSTWFERGAGVVSRQLVGSLSEHGRVFVYARGEKYARGNSNWDLPYVHWGKRLHWAGSGKIDKRDFMQWISSNRIDCLIFNEQRWWQPIKWAKEKGVKCGAYVDYYTDDTISAFVAYDFLLCNTTQHYSVFKWHPGAILVPWGTDTNVFKPEDGAWGDRSGQVVFFHSAGMQPARKGTDIVVEAFQSIRESVNARLVIHTQRPLDFSVGPNVEVILRTVGAPGLYHLGDVYVYPTRLDGIGLTVCEALSCGLPVIATDVAPMTDFVKDGENGILVKVTGTHRRSDGYYWPMSEVTAKDLALGMRWFCENPEGLRRMKSVARLDAVARLDWKTNAKGIYEQVESVPIRCLERGTVKLLLSADRRGPKGWLDLLLEVPIAREIISGIFFVYRRLREPEIYRD